MAQVGSLWVRLGIIDKDFEQGLKKAERDLNQFGNRLSNLGQRLTVGLSIPLALVSGAAIKLGMDAVESESLFSVSMGKMADSAREWSEDLRKNLGLNAYELRKNVGMLYTMFNSMKMGERASYDMAKGLTQLAYDMASFYNLNPEEAFQKLQAGITGEVEPLKRLGIVVNETATKQWALTNGMIKQGETLSEQQKIVARYNVIMEATSKAQGDLARTMDSPTNKLRMLKEEIKNTATDLGISLLPAVSKFLEAIKPLVKTIGDMVKAFSELPEPARNTILAFVAVTAAIGPMLIIVGKVITALSALPGIFVATGAGAATLTGTLGVLASAFAPFLIGGAIIVGLVALGSALEYAKKQAEELPGKLRDETVATEDLIKKVDELQKKQKLTNEEKQEYINVSNKLAEIMPGVVKGHDDEYNAIIDLTTAYEELNKKKKETIEADIKLAIANKNESANKVRMLQEQLETLNNNEKQTLALNPSYGGYDEKYAREIRAKNNNIRRKLTAEIDYWQKEWSRWNHQIRVFDEQLQRDNPYIVPSKKKSTTTSSGKTTTTIEPPQGNKANEFDLNNTLADFKKERADLIATATALGDTENLNADLASNLQREIALLISNGYKPEQKVLTDLIAEYNKYSSAAEESKKRKFDLAEVTKRLEENMAELNAREELFGKSTELDTQKIQLLESTMVQMVANGIDPQSEAVQQLMKAYQELSDSLLETELAFDDLDMEEETEKLYTWRDVLKEISDETANWNQQMVNIAEDTAYGIERAFSDISFDIVKGKFKDIGDAFQNLLDGILRSLTNMFAQMAVQKFLNWFLGMTGGYDLPANFFPSSLIPDNVPIAGRASGGDVYAGTPYYVGEVGRELFVPETNGTIIPNNRLGGGEVVVNLINNGQPLQEDRRQVQGDLRGTVMTLWLEGVKDNVGGSREVIKAMAGGGA